ncbi:ABC transporter ATP-binding protein [Azohydromonas aeria]|uniref:ABC transporter ATP-binding protein n=1 Tax=Azohydromonas aeria TaxID=2590212 RepID=UPI0035BF50C3
MHLELPPGALDPLRRREESPLIELHDASVRFAEHQALQPLSLRIHPGERVMLIGPNGSGKTTLLRLLHGQLRVTAGERRVQRDAQGREPRQAMLFQRPFLLRLSVWRNLLLALWLAGVPRRERAGRAEQALRRVGLQEHRDRPARVLSGGQQQRLALARAWAVHPQVLFLDEPTASLDPAAKREVEALVLDFAAEGMTVVMSTHNLGQAKRMATRVIYLEDGRLVVDRPVANFFNDPLPQEAALFLKGELPWH